MSKKSNKNFEMFELKTRFFSTTNVHFARQIIINNLFNQYQINMNLGTEYGSMTFDKLTSYLWVYRLPCGYNIFWIIIHALI